jgi:hypothetical protein
LDIELGSEKRATSSRATEPATRVSGPTDSKEQESEAKSATGDDVQVMVSRIRVRNRLLKMLIDFFDGRMAHKVVRRCKGYGGDVGAMVKILM